MTKHIHKWKSMKPDYWGFICECGAWSAVKEPKEKEICYEGSTQSRDMSACPQNGQN